MLRAITSWSTVSVGLSNRNKIARENFHSRYIISHNKVEQNLQKERLLYRPLGLTCCRVPPLHSVSYLVQNIFNRNAFFRTRPFENEISKIWFSRKKSIFFQNVAEIFRIQSRITEYLEWRDLIWLYKKIKCSISDFSIYVFVFSSKHKKVLNFVNRPLHDDPTKMLS